MKWKVSQSVNERFNIIFYFSIKFLRKKTILCYIKRYVLRLFLKSIWLELMFSTDVFKTVFVKNLLLPPAYVVRREGNVLTRVCPSVCPQGGYPYPIILCNITQNSMGQTPREVPSWVQLGGARTGGYPARGYPGRVPPAGYPPGQDEGVPR